MGDKIRVFGKPGCVDCDNVDAILAAEGVVYDHYNVLEQPDALKELKRICAERGSPALVPVIIFPPPTNRVFIEPQDEELRALGEALRAFKAFASHETG